MLGGGNTARVPTYDITGPNGAAIPGIPEVPATPAPNPTAPVLYPQILKEYDLAPYKCNRDILNVSQLVDFR
jgi:hypothetical protein